MIFKGKEVLSLVSSAHNDGDGEMLHGLKIPIRCVKSIEVLGEVEGWSK